MWGVFTMPPLQVKAWEGMYDPAVEYKKSLIKKEINPLLWYPTVYFLITILPLVNRCARCVRCE